MAARRVGARHGGRRAPPGLRGDWRDDAASSRLNGTPFVLRNAPLWVSVRDVARSWGVPPWEVEAPGVPPDEATVSRWFHRERALRSLGI